MLDKLTIQRINKSVLEYFPSTRAIIVFGSVANDNYVENSSDVDLLIILPDDSSTNLNLCQKRLISLINELKTEMDLDPAIATINNIKNDFNLISAYNTRNAHEMDQYLIKTGKIIYGDKKILKLLPNISLEQALDNIIPHIKNVFIPSLKKELDKTNNTNKFLVEYADKFYVIIRTIYALENNKIASKLEALDCIGSKYNRLKDICNYLSAIYTNQDKNNLDINKKNIIYLLNII